MAFIKLISDIIGGPVFSAFMKDKKYDYLDLMREFESVKRNVGLTSTDSVRMKIPVSFNDTCRDIVKKDFKELVQRARKDKEITFIGDKAKFDAKLMKDLFKKTTDKIVDQMKKILAKPGSGQKVSLILMVGGFSESTYVQEVVKKEFHDKNGRKVLIPKDAGISVVQGAVVFGRQPGNITSRVLRYTYGAQVCRDYKEGEYDPKRKFKDDYGVDKCSGIFGTFLSEGTEVTVGKSVEETYFTSKPYQQDSDLLVFISSDANAKYTDARGCRKLGHLTIKIPTPSKEKRKLVVKYIFGDTELHVEGLDVGSNTPCRTTLKMLE